MDNTPAIVPLLEDLASAQPNLLIGDVPVEHVWQTARVIAQRLAERKSSGEAIRIAANSTRVGDHVGALIGAELAGVSLVGQILTKIAGSTDEISYQLDFGEGGLPGIDPIEIRTGLDVDHSATLKLSSNFRWILPDIAKPDWATAREIDAARLQQSIEELADVFSGAVDAVVCLSPQQSAPCILSALAAIKKGLPFRADPQNEFRDAAVFCDPRHLAALAGGQHRTGIRVLVVDCEMGRPNPDLVAAVRENLGPEADVLLVNVLRNLKARNEDEQQLLKIEQLMLAISGAKDAVVFQNPKQGHDGTIAFVEFAEGVNRIQRIALIKKKIRDEFGAEAVPAQFWPASNLPKNRAGQVDRAACAAEVLRAAQADDDT